MPDYTFSFESNEEITMSLCTIRKRGQILLRDYQNDCIKANGEILNGKVFMDEKIKSMLVEL